MKIQAYFNTACEKLGFVEAFGLLRRIIKFAPKDDDLGTRIALKYLERLKIQELIDTVNCEIADLVEQIFEDKHFIDEDKAMYAYNYFCAVFDVYYQEKTLELVSAINQDSFSAAKLKNTDIWKNVQAQYKDGSLFQFDTSCSLFPGIRHTFPSTYEVLYEGFWKSVPDRVGNKIGNYLNKCIQEIMPHLVLSFKMDGINTLLNMLDGEMYRYRNYKYTNDISFGPMLRNTTEFKKLSSLLAAIPYDEKSQLCGYYFLKKDRIPFNFLLQYELRSLSSDQRTQCVARYEKDGMYAIGGFYFDYIHAMKYVERNILLEEITIFIHVDTQSGDGFQIQFNRK